MQKIASEARPDYIFTQEGGWRFNMSFDVGKHFLVGDYSGVDPSWYLGVDINAKLQDGYEKMIKDREEYNEKLL